MITYKHSGVDTAAGDRAVELMKRHVEKTRTPNVIGGIGAFGGLFRADLKSFKDPILVSGTDGVGTKLKLAFALDRHNTIGVDCVAMCVNDLIAMGASPMFFLDYIATERLVPEKIEKIVQGLCEGCISANCALLGGETAEMPGFYGEGEYDLAGFAVGIVDREELIDGSRIQPGDVLVGWPSSGFHSNGFSLVREVLSANKVDLSNVPVGFSRSIGEELLTPTRIYVDLFERLKEVCDLKGIAHITGGGIVENVARILPPRTGVEVYLDSWSVPPVFEFILKLGKLESAEAYRTFNMGIGLITIVSPKEVQKVMREFAAEKPIEMGIVLSGREGVELCERG